MGPFIQAWQGDNLIAESKTLLGLADKIANIYCDEKPPIIDRMFYVTDDSETPLSANSVKDLNDRIDYETQLIKWETTNGTNY